VAGAHPADHPLDYVEVDQDVQGREE
jgi:hypothetical protein